MVLDRARSNYRNLRLQLHRAFVRPDPYGLPGWITDSDRLSEKLAEEFRGEFRNMIDVAADNEVEVGRFICYDAYKDVLKLGPLCWGHKQMVVIKDCIGYRSIGSYHVHLGQVRNVSFSPPDIQGGLHEFALAVGGNIPAYEMAVLSPFNYWKLSPEQKNEVDYSLNMATRLMLLANSVYEQQAPDWKNNVLELERVSTDEMNHVYDLLNLAYVTL